MNIACLLDSDYEDSEYEKPAAAFREAGHTVTVIGLTSGAQLEGKKGSSRTVAEKGVDEVHPEDFDALFLPGGYSPDHLRADRRMVDFTRALWRTGRPVLAICHGPQLLISAEVVQGRRMTAWSTVQHDLRCCGADVADEEVVVDGNLVTSRKPDDIPAFTRAALDLLGAPARRG